MVIDNNAVRLVGVNRNVVLSKCYLVKSYEKVFKTCYFNMNLFSLTTYPIWFLGLVCEVESFIIH